jgi:hypothetical protein
MNTPLNIKKIENSLNFNNIVKTLNNEHLNINNNEYAGYYLSEDLMTIYEIKHNNNRHFLELKYFTFPINIINDKVNILNMVFISFKRRNNLIYEFQIDLPRASNITFLKYANKPNCYN